MFSVDRKLYKDTVCTRARTYSTYNVVVVKLVFSLLHLNASRRMTSHKEVEHGVGTAVGVGGDGAGILRGMCPLLR